MIYTDEGIDHARINYNLGRLDVAKREREKEAREEFHMDANKTGPRTFPQVLQHMKEGKLTFKELPREKENNIAIDSNGRLFDWGFLQYVDFVDPDTPKPDNDGFQKALDGISEQYTAAKDIIMIDTDPSKGLAAVKAFANA